MLKVSEEELDAFEQDYQGVKKMILGFESASLPSCANCGSEDTASVQVGIIGRTTRIAAATTKVHLRSNGRPGDFFCNSCREYFG
ncbi:hypothetical protein [Adhaeretor mobilis]|uniref:Uncharacterized protein n=1 Tax=Adhaeretor mobilis TaxID=1930276 RepID=A0A517MW02_9BACT|nr:hypothetical protein [Adhaeretor mobilis]QDS99061.1 hypothetical protein HG15A2_23510 [Adhaeretor mobilis]